MACEDSDPDSNIENGENGILLSETSLTFGAGAESKTVSMSTNHEWAVSASDSWISVSPKYGTEKKSDLIISVEKNTEYDERKGSITIMSGAERASINIEQSGDKTAPNPDDIVCPLDGYELVWNDEFDNGTTLSDDWTHEVQKSGWVNNELQNYVNGTADGKRVTELVDGKLNIHCFKGSDGKIYSGRVYAKVDKGWLRGYFEARILLPKGKGTWPAFWMMPVNNNYQTNPWPGCGEIDIMEEVGVVPNEVSSSIHCNAYNHTIGTQKTAKKNIGTAETEFHVYACEWTEEYLRFFVDGTELMTFRNEGKGKDTWPFTYAFYPILNLAWGGSWGGMNGVDESALPVTMTIDYVRVFQKK